MTGKIKLNAASGGGSVSFQAPSSTGDDRVITLPTTADGTVLTTTNPKSGNIIQVVSDTKTDTQSFQSPNFSTISGLSVSITPSSSSNKILIHYSISVSCNNYGMFLLRRNTSTFPIRGDADGNRTNCTFESGLMNQYESQICSGTFLDSPSTTSALTYDFSCATPDSSSSELFINRYKTDNDSGYVARTSSTITAMEVAA